jgi:hypothetical protein
MSRNIEHTKSRLWHELKPIEIEKLKDIQKRTLDNADENLSPIGKIIFLKEGNIEGIASFRFVYYTNQTDY